MCVANIPDKLTEYLKNIRHMQLLHKTDLQSPSDSMTKNLFAKIGRIFEFQTRSGWLLFEEERLH